MSVAGLQPPRDVLESRSAPKLCLNILTSTQFVLSPVLLLYTHTHTHSCQNGTRATSPLSVPVSRRQVTPESGCGAEEQQWERPD